MHFDFKNNIKAEIITNNELVIINEIFLFFIAWKYVEIINIAGKNNNEADNMLIIFTHWFIITRFEVKIIINRFEKINNIISSTIEKE